MFPEVDMFCTNPAQQLRTADQSLRRLYTVDYLFVKYLSVDHLLVFPTCGLIARSLPLTKIQYSHVYNIFAVAVGFPLVSGN